MRVYSNTATQTKLASAIDAAVTTIALSDATGWPEPSGGDVALAAIDYGRPTHVEIVTYSGRMGNQLTGVTRAQDDTDARSHNSAARVWHVASASDIANFETHRLASAPHAGHETPAGAQAKVDMHTADTSSVHGLTDTAQVALKNATNTFTQEQRATLVVVKESPVDVRHPDFGGVDTTGAADCTTAIQAALAASGGGPVFLPKGTLRVASSVTLPEHWQRFFGAGMERTKLKADAGVSIFSVTAGRHGLTFEDISFEGQATPAEKAFALSGTPLDFQAWFNRCKFTNLSHSIDLGSTTTEITGSEFRRCEFSNAPLRLVSAGAKNTLTFWKCRWSALAQNVPAFEISNTSGSTLDVLLQFYACTWEAIDRQAVRLNKVSDVIFDGCYFEFCNTDAVAGLPWIDIDGGGTTRILFRDLYAAGSGTSEIIGTSGATTTFYGVRLENIGFQPTTLTIDRALFPDLIEFNHPADGTNRFNQTTRFSWATDDTRWQFVSGGRLFDNYYQSEAYPRIRLERDSGISFGSGAAAVDTSVRRLGADLAGTASGDKFVANAGLGVGNSAAATTPGTVVRKMQVFDAAGNSLGYVPIYDAIT